MSDIKRWGYHAVHVALAFVDEKRAASFSCEVRPCRGLIRIYPALWRVGYALERLAMESKRARSRRQREGAFVRTSETSRFLLTTMSSTLDWFFSIFATTPDKPSRHHAIYEFAMLDCYDLLLHEYRMLRPIHTQEVRRSGLRPREPIDILRYCSQTDNLPSVTPADRYAHICFACKTRNRPLA